MFYLVKETKSLHSGDVVRVDFNPSSFMMEAHYGYTVVQLTPLTKQV